MSSQIKQTNRLNDVIDFSKVMVKDVAHTNYTTPISGFEQNNYVHGDIKLEKRLPAHTAVTNTGYNIHKRIEYENEIHLDRNTPSTNFTIDPILKTNIDISSRKYNLPTKLNPGGFDGGKQIPSYNRNNNIPIIKNNKSELFNLSSKLTNRDY